MDSLLHDIRYGFRKLVNNPGFTLAAVVTLALGIGANTANFSVIDAYLLRPLPYPAPDRLIHLFRIDRQSGSDQMRFSLDTFLELKKNNGVFEDLGAYNYRYGNLSSTDQQPERISVGRVSTNLYPLLGVEPLLGRNFRPEEGEPGQGRVALLSHGVWQRHFGSSPDILGRTVKLDDEPYTVVGVMPKDFNFPFGGVKMWVPLEIDTQRFDREYRNFMFVGRLKPGATPAEAQAELETLYGQIQQEYYPEDIEYGVSLVPLRQALLFLFDTLQLMFLLLTVAVGFLLLVVCANVANLMLTRAVGRQKEFAIRSALGAGRGRLVRGLLTEGVLVALAGGALGVGLAYAIIGAFGPNFPEDLYRVGEITVDGMALIFTLAVSLVTALLFCLAPSLQTSSPDLSGNLKDGLFAGGLKGRRLQSFLVVSEVTLALVLLIGSTLMLQSFLRMQHVDPGFLTENVLSLEMHLPDAKYGDDQQVEAFYRQVLERVRTLPGVESAALVHPLPLNFESHSREFTIEGRPPATPDERLAARLHQVSPAFFETMGIPVLQGNGFSERHHQDTVPVVVISRSMALRFWPDTDPIGQRLRWKVGDEELLASIIGVVGDTKEMFVHEESPAIIYSSQFQEPQRRNFLQVRASGDPLSLVASVRGEIWSVEPSLPLSAIRSMEEVASESMMPWRVVSIVLSVFGAAALTLAAVGIYGVMAYAIAQRTREIGIRMALGARAADVLRMALRHGMLLTFIGVGVGLAASFGLARAMASILFGVGAHDPLTFVGVTIGVVAVALIASYVPARRATRVDPIVVLRYE